MRAFLHYLLGLVLLSFYGGEVCPFVERLGLYGFALELAVIFPLVYILRSITEAVIIEKLSELTAVKAQFINEFAAYLLIAVIVTVFNTIVYDFPVGSGIKVSVGVITAGLFTGLDMSLLRERNIIKHIKDPVELNFTQKSSLTRKFAVFAISALALVTGVILLVIMKDLTWIIEADEDSLKQATMAIAVEIIFVMVALLGMLLNLIISWSINLKVFFENETAVLEAVAAGDLSKSVPVFSRDEFATIATHTNKMILELREKAKIKDLFGKVVSPQIAERLLNDEPENLKGRRQQLAILVADIRSFTSFSETIEARRMVDSLNLYFSEMVKVIHRNNGEIDKFIGDGILAVFGLHNNDACSDEALKASIEMLNKVEQIREKVAFNLSIRIGLHFGDVIAGQIGSPERLEYTVIGDAVNVASRLEQAAKDEKYDLLLSDNLASRLTDKSGIVEVGSRQLRGRTEPVTVYTLK